VGHNDSRAVAQQLVNRALDDLLGGRIQPGRGLIQNHQAGVLQEDARERQQLRLSRRKAAPAGLQTGVKTAWQRAIPVAQLQLFDYFQDALVGNVTVEERQVVAHAGLKQLHILGDHRHAPPQIVQPELAQIDPVQPHHTGRYIVEPEDQPRHGRLAAARAPQQSQHAPRRQPEVQPVQHRFAIHVGEGHTLKAQLQRAGRDRRAGAVDDLGLEGAQLG